MNSQNPKETHGKNSPNVWTASDVESLMMALTFCYGNQNTYKDPLDLKARIAGWKFILEEDFPMDRVLAAIKIFMKKNNNMPVPADIHAILSPPPRKISTAEYIHAQKQHAAEGFPMFGYYGGVIADYEAQQAAERTPEPPALSIAHQARRQLT